MKHLAIAAAVAALTVGTALAQGTSQAPASGSDNQTVATNAATADMPAKGANSFTIGQAATRIADHGYSDVTGLKKDQDGVWRGEASKAGQQVTVWLDYKGNVGQQ
jgi:hypothetical protein